MTTMDRYNGLTINPKAFYNGSEAEHINFDKTQIEWAGSREQILQEFNQLEKELLRQNELIGELSTEYSELSSEYSVDGERADFYIDQLQDLVGGYDEYWSLMTWAEESLDENVITQYDQLMVSNEHEERRSNLLNLYTLYQKSHHFSDNSHQDYYESNNEGDVP